jgi:hypothetical protein
MNHGPRCERDPDRRPVWLTAAPQELTSAGQAGPGPPLATVTAAPREIIHCSKTYAPLFAEAEDLEHIHFPALPRTDHPNPSFRGPSAFTTGKRHRPGARAGQGTDHQQTRNGCEPTRAARAAGPGRSTPGAAQARRAAASTATSGMESKAVRHPRKPSIPQISRFCVRTLATTAGICRGPNEHLFVRKSGGDCNFNGVTPEE